MFLEYQLPEFQLLVATEDIRDSKEWQVGDDQHHFIVHLGGQMDSLETEIDGHAGSVGPAVAGETWTVPAEHSYRSRAKGGDIRYAVLSIRNRIDSSTTECDILAGCRDERLYSAVASLATNVSNLDDVSQMHIRELSASIYSHLETKYLHGADFTKRDDDPKLNPSLARYLRDFVFEKLTEQITVDALAKLAGMTPHHLLIAFKQSFGTTPAQYVIVQRIRRAQWLLLHTSHDVTRIAMETGFASHSHLTSAFRSRVGFSPSDFRSRFK